MKDYRSTQQKVEENARKIESGEKEDDFKNHFLSHFGFHEPSNEKEVMHNLDTYRDIYRK